MHEYVPVSVTSDLLQSSVSEQYRVLTIHHVFFTCVPMRTIILSQGILHKLEEQQSDFLDGHRESRLANMGIYRRDDGASEGPKRRACVPLCLPMRPL